MKVELTVNGERLETDVWAGESLLATLRDRLGLPGSKNACEQGECGSCSVLLDGELVCSCLVLAAQADGHDVITVEGLAEADRLRATDPARARAIYEAVIELYADKSWAADAVRHAQKALSLDSARDAHPLEKE